MAQTGYTAYFEAVPLTEDFAETLRDYSPLPELSGLGFRETPLLPRKNVLRKPPPHLRHVTLPIVS